MKKPMIFEGIVAILIIIILFILYLMVTGSGHVGPTSPKWTIASNDTVSSLYLGKDGVLYAFMGDGGSAVYAIGGDGNVRWKYDIPDRWRAISDFWFALGSSSGYIGDWQYGSPVYSEDNGTLYLYVREDKEFPRNESGINIGQRLLAISPEGKLLWNVSLSDKFHPFDQAGVYAAGGRVYAFCGYNETVFDKDGNRLFSISNVSDPPAIDESGYIYAVKARPAYDPYFTLDPYYNFMAPSSIVEAYAPDGTQCWQANVTSDARRGMWQSGQKDGGYVSLPICRDHKIYVPVKDGIYALNLNGSVAWSREYNVTSSGLYRFMPFDDKGNVYFEVLSHGDQPWLAGKWYINVIQNDGKDDVQVSSYPMGGGVGDPATGVFYYWSNQSLAGKAGDDELSRMEMPEITAYDLSGNKTLWSHTLPVGEPRILTIDLYNATDKSVNPGVFEEAIRKNEEYKMFAPGTAPTKPYYTGGGFNLKIIPGGDVVYISYYTCRYEMPLVLNKSRYAYTGGVYTLDRNGTLLWYNPTNAYVTGMAANNSTIYYGTRNGMVSSGDLFVGGFTILAILYVSVHFFMAGTVSRARSRLGLNANRNCVLKFISDNPGSTMSEISRGTWMNLGTVRYHLLILGINHRIVANKSDGKSIRYFTNVGSYGDDEQLIVSLVRRDPMRKILGVLAEKPGISNRELSWALDMQESAISRYMKELLEKGVVTRDDGAEGRPAYSINNDYRKVISTALDLSYST